MVQKIAAFLILTFGLFISVSLNAQASTIDSLFRQPSDPIAGNPRGKVTLVEFFDYQCSHCSDMVSVINNIIRANPNVRVVLKDLPVLGQMSEFAARAALAAKRQGKYYRFHDALFASRQRLTEESVFSTAREVGLNVEQLKSDMNSAGVRAQIKANLSLASYLGIPGTPAILVGETTTNNIGSIKFAPGAVSQRTLQQMIDDSAN